ncbi:hypothetical protein [Streptomyces sp. H39-C1]|uniref:hypothetical protein n=1 Tax=Streptomyces sp. H39-C1 TaxID=3004355 RepID=UPI0022B0754F|nr:hypothetical protein [Streptomyces sp. H39-C1]MCZ4099791.1 hypothetical protein [Streptomyces sp. H39-C1]
MTDYTGGDDGIWVGLMIGASPGKGLPVQPIVPTNPSDDPFEHYDNRLWKVVLAGTTGAVGELVGVVARSGSVC